MSEIGTKETKLVYVKRWRTLVELPAKYADEIVESLRCSADSADGSYLSDRVFEGVRSIDAEDAERLKASYVASRTSAQQQASADSASLRDALDNSQSLLVMIDLVGPDSASWIKEDMRDLLTKQIVENRTSLSDPKRAEPQSASMPQNVEVAIKRMKTLADTALPGRTYEEECQAQLRNACVLLEVAYRSQAENVALQDARDEFEAIRLLLINDLAEPGRSAFWKAVNARDKIAALTRPKCGG